MWPSGAASSLFFVFVLVQEVRYDARVRAVKSALLIGAPNGLKGVRGDLDLMERALAARGFDVARCEGEAATRAGILAQLECLVAAAGRLSEVCFYYSGHGGRVELRRGEGSPEAAVAARFVPFLMPTDIKEGVVLDFRGILVAELESYFQEIVDGGARLTVIMDCCHAAAVVRGDERGDGPQGASVAVRALSLAAAPCLAGLVGHYVGLAEAPGSARLGGGCCPTIVRLVASGPAEAAFERPAAAVRLRAGVDDPVRVGEVHGVMTAALARALVEVGEAKAPWFVVGRRVRALAAAGSRQQVLLRGPQRRVVFSGEEEAGRGSFGGLVRRDDAWVADDYGEISGATVGDELLVWPMTAGAGALGVVRVVRVDASRAWVEAVGWQLDAQDPRLALASLSRTERSGRPPARVRVVSVSGSVAAELARSLATCGSVATVVGTGDEEVAAELVEGGGLLKIRRPGGGLLREPVEFVPHKAPTIAEEALLWAREALAAVAVGEALKAAVRGRAAASSLGQVGWSITRRGRDGQESVVDPRAGGRTLQVEIGDRLVVDVHKVDGAAGSLWVWLLMVGPGGRVSLLSDSWPRGAELSCAAPLTLGLRPDGARTGWVVTWPEVGVPRPRDGGDGGGALALVVADGPADLTPWLTEVAAGWRPGADPLAGGGVRARAEPLCAGVREARARTWTGEVVELWITG